MIHSVCLGRGLSILGVAALGSCLLLAGCGSNSSGGPTSIVNPPPVQAQTSYSNASLNGTYSFSEFGQYVPNSTPVKGYPAYFSGIGILQLDGNGNITSGSVTQYIINSGPNESTCVYTLSGSYTLPNSASGTASITETPAASGTCGTAASIPFTLEASGQGASLALAESDGISIVTGTAIKQ